MSILREIDPIWLQCIKNREVEKNNSNRHWKEKNFLSETYIFTC